MLQINSKKEGKAVVTVIKMSNDVTPEENYETFIAVALSFAEIMADGAKSNGLNVSTSDVVRKIAEDILKKTNGKAPVDCEQESE